MKKLLFTFLLVTLVLSSESTTIIEDILGTLIKPGINLLIALGRTFPVAKENFNRWFFFNYKAVEDEYDIIIVGSGSAGSVLANRLSEIDDWRVLLIEAGKPEVYPLDLPLFAPAWAMSKDYNWHYVEEYQEHMNYGLENQRMLWPRGKGLGGTTLINYMIYTRGFKGDYDRWAAAGNPGWSYDDVQPYFKKLEHVKVKNADYTYRGTEGPQSVEDIYQSKFVEAFIRAGQELDHPHADYTVPSENGFPFSTVQATVKKGHRHTSAKAFIWPVRKRKNLTIALSTFVTKILIDPESKEAYGVEFEKNGHKRQVRATKEVILSAGTFNSPKLLMLSGVGPEEHLMSLKIPVIQNLRVGENLYDHLTFPGLAFTTNHTTSLRRELLKISNILKYITKGEGPYTSLGGVEGLGYFRTNVTNDLPENIPDIELIFVGATLEADFGIVTRRAMSITDKVYNNVLRPITSIPQWTIFPMLLHPKSVGKLLLRSTNPKDPPKLYGRFFTDPNNTDIKSFIAAIRYIQRIANTDAFQELNSRINPNPTPGCEKLTFDSDEYWECTLRTYSVTLHHQIGTCKMGPETDTGAVVDSEAKVYGIKKLRVADNSIVPFTLSAHTNAPGMMIGERVADIIKENHGKLGIKE